MVSRANLRRNRPQNALGPGAQSGDLGGNAAMVKKKKKKKKISYKWWYDIKVHVTAVV